MIQAIELDEISLPADLTRNGFEFNTGGIGSEPFNLDLINRIRSVIQSNFNTTIRVRKQSGSHSYTLKHRVEKHINQYCSNGDLIAAMIAEGYLIKRDNINCFFNVDPKSTILSDNRI